MTKYSKLLSQIIAYLKDKLPNSKRNALEQDISADPFLSDAMDGFSKISPDELESDLFALTQQLNARTKPQNDKRIYIYFGIAASIAILIGIGVLYFDFENNNSQVAQQLEAAQAKKKKEAQVDTNRIDTLLTHSPKRMQDSSALQVLLYSRPTTQLAPKNSNKKIKTKAERKRVSKRKHKKTIQKNNKHLATPTASNVEKKEALLASKSFKVKGIIKAKEDSIPLPGVNITVKGTVAGTVSGFDGEYELEVKPGDILVYTYIGFEPKEEVVSNEVAEVADIRLSNQENILDEVVVVGYGVQKKKQIVGAVSGISSEKISKTRSKNRRFSEKKKQKHYKPQGGFRKFKKYIKKNKLIDRSNTLEVQVELTIESTGKVNHVRIISTCSAEVQTEIIRLLNEGPSWKQSSDDYDADNNKVLVTIVL